VSRSRCRATAPPVETPVTTVVQETEVTVQQMVKNKVDILFMIDDSPSMTPKQDALKQKFPELIKVLDDFGAKGSPAWYHIGVVTSDLGAGQSTSTSNCKPGGLGAQLQSKGKAAGSTCVAPGNGLNFIDYNQLNGTNNLPTGQDLPTTFTCMASVGDTGCGFEHQLEAPYRALKNCMPAADGSYPNCTIPQNKNFLRPDSILAVVFVTDEDDDCSAPDDTDLFDLNKTGTYGSLLSYRGTQYGVMCNYGGMDQLMPYADSGGALMGCHAAPNPMTITADTGNSQGAPPAGQGKCMDVQRYINFYKNSSLNNGGGVRATPDDVILAAIDGPENPVQSIIANPQTYAPCAAGSMVDGVKCAVLLAHSCNASADFFADPAVRINQVINSVSSQNANNITSICAMDYTSALTNLGMKIVSHLGIACLSSPITDPNNPDCVVEDRADVDNSVVDSIQSCALTNNVQPCWKYVENDKCAKVVNPINNTITQGSISIMRDQSTIPPGTHARVACATIAHTSGGTNPSPGP
jgi:hypothetical protein